MGKGKDQRIAEKQKIKLVKRRNVHFEDIKGASQKSFNDKKKAVENITKLRTRSKGKGFKNLKKIEKIELRESRKTKCGEYLVNWDLKNLRGNLLAINTF